MSETKAELSQAEIEKVIAVAYKDGFFGPVAFADTDPMRRAIADRENLMHLAAGGWNGETNISRRSRDQLVAALEELFGFKYHFDIRPGKFVTFHPLTNVFWRPWDLGPFES
jgi:hypothetical protein